MVVSLRRVGVAGVERGRVLRAKGLGVKVARIRVSLKQQNEDSVFMVLLVESLKDRADEIQTPISVSTRRLE
jgi:hypothetical protein